LISLVKTIAFILVAFIFLSSKELWAEKQSIEMLAGLTKPPFVIADEGKGMQIEIIEAAFARSDALVHFTYIPLSRHLDVFRSRDYDGIITLTDHEKQEGICFSKPYIIYQNVAVSLVESAFNIDVVEDLTDLKVAAFQNATRFLGDKYKATFKDSDGYTELADQNSQVAMLFSNRIDAVVMDINIFKHILANRRHENPNNKTYKKKYEIHFLFTPKVYTAGFKSLDLCQRFDQGINEIVADGSYQKIIDSYLE